MQRGSNLQPTDLPSAKLLQILLLCVRAFVVGDLIMPLFLQYIAKGTLLILPLKLPHLLLLDFRL